MLQDDDWKEKLRERNRQLLSSNEPPSDIVGRPGGQTQVSFHPVYKFRGGESDEEASDSSMDDFIVNDEDGNDEDVAEMREGRAQSVKSVKPARLSGDEEAVFDSAGKGDAKRLREILDRAPFLARAFRNGTTPLHKAASAGSVECIQALVQCGAQINIREEIKTVEDKKPRVIGVTPLLAAIQAGHEDATMWLLLNGADVMFCDNDNTLPVHMAAAALGVLPYPSPLVVN
jgi:hypothetical protein